MEINCLLFTVSRAEVRLIIACFFINSRLNALSLAAVVGDVVAVAPESEIDNTWGTAVEAPPPPPDFTAAADDDDDDGGGVSVGVIVVIVVGGGGGNTSISLELTLLIAVLPSAVESDPTS